MTDPTPMDGLEPASPSGPVPHDGWKSRKIVAGICASSAFFVASTAALLISGIGGYGFFSADQWIGTQQTTTMPTILIALGFLTWEKWAAKGRR